MNFRLVFLHPYDSLMFYIHNIHLDFVVKNNIQESVTRKAINCCPKKFRAADDFNDAYIIYMYVRNKQMRGSIGAIFFRSLCLFSCVSNGKAYIYFLLAVMPTA